MSARSVQSGKKGVTTYSPKIRHIMATCEGFITRHAVHAYRKAGSAPKASRMYVYSPPHEGIIVPNSAYDMAPHTASTPHIAQTIRAIPAEPEAAKTPFGEAKIPLPIIVPTITATPAKRPTSRFILMLLDGTRPLTINPSSEPLGTFPDVLGGRSSLGINADMVLKIPSLIPVDIFQHKNEV